MVNLQTMKLEGRKMLNVREETWERLRQFGTFRQSTDDVLNKLMDAYESGQGQQSQQQQKKGSKK